jgi:hypothetical protein
MVPLAQDRNPMIAELMQAVAAAARSFESRWTLHSLKLVDPDLHALFLGQRADWDAALVTGTDAEARAETEAMLRGWLAVTRRMEDQEPNAWIDGQCPTTGLRVAIGTQIAAAEYLAPDVIWISPDEVATLLSVQREILAIKRLAPGATVEEIAMRHDQP